MVAGPPGTLVTQRSPLKERPSRPTRLESVEGLFRSGRIVDDVRRLALREIAKELGRTPGATAVQASKFGLSLIRRPVVRRENAQAKDRLTFLS